MMVIARRMFQNRRLSTIDKAIRDRVIYRKKVLFLKSLINGYNNNHLINAQRRKVLLHKGFLGLKHRVEYRQLQDAIQLVCL